MSGQIYGMVRLQDIIYHWIQSQSDLSMKVYLSNGLSPIKSTCYIYACSACNYVCAAVYDEMIITLDQSGIMSYIKPSNPNMFVQLRAELLKVNSEHIKCCHEKVDHEKTD